MNSKKFITLLLSVLMIFSQVQGVFAIDFNQPAFNAEERIEIEGVEKDGELIFDFGPAIEEAEKTRSKSSITSANGLEIGDEIISGPVRGTGEKLKVQYKVTAKMTGLNGGEFDWSVFEDENFVADLTFLDASHEPIEDSTPIAFNKNNVTKGVNYTLTTDKVATSDQISPSIAIKKIDNNLDIRAYFIKPSNPSQAMGVYKIEFEVVQILNPQVTIEWKNADGSPMIDANRPADTDLKNIASVGGLDKGNELKFNLMAKDGVYNLLRPYMGEDGKPVRPLTRDRDIRTKLNQVADETQVTAELTGKADGKVTINGKEYAVATSYSKEEGFKYTFTYPADGVCLTKDALQEQFEQAANPMFAKVGSKEGVYIGHFDEAKKEVTVYIIDKTKGAKDISGTGLIAGLTELYKNNYLTKIQVGNEKEKDLKQLAEAAPGMNMTVEQMFKFVIGADLLNAVQAQGNTGKLADFVNKTVVLKITLEQEGCGNAIIVEYKVSGKEAAASLLNGKLAPQDISVWVNEVFDWKDGVKVTEDNADLKALLDKATVKDLGEGGTEDNPKAARTSAAKGKFTGNLLVTFEDGSTLVVENQDLYVREENEEITDENDNWPLPKDGQKVTFNFDDTIKSFADASGNEPNPIVSTIKRLIKTHKTLTDADFPKVIKNTGYTDPVTWKGNVANEGYVVTKDNNVFTASATKTPAVCKTKDALKAEFETAANAKFASVQSKDKVYKASYDANKHSINIKLLDKTKKNDEIKGTGLIVGLFDLWKNNDLYSIQIDNTEELPLTRTLSTVPAENQMSFMKVLVGSKLTEAVKAKTGKDPKTFADLDGVKLVVSVKVKQEDCDNAVSLIYTVNIELQKDVVPQNPGEDKPNVPDNFVKVDFSAGAHGTIADTETTIYWVNPTKEVTVTAPAVTPNPGYTQKTGADAWNHALTATFAEATTITAQYNNTTPGTACLTEAGLKAQFEDAINSMFGGISSKPGIYEGSYDASKKEVTVKIIDASQKAAQLSGTGLASGLDKLYKNNHLIKIQVGTQDERDLDVLALAQPTSGLTLQQLFATIFGTDVLNEVQKTGEKTGTLLDFIDKSVVLKLTIQQKDCEGEKPSVILEYIVKGIDGNPSKVPTIDKVTEGDKKITGKGEKDAKIVVKDEDGRTIGETTVKPDGTWEVEVPDGREPKKGDKITATQIEEGKNPSKPAEITVVGKDTPVIPTPKYSEKPIINPIYDSDDVVTGRGVPGATVEVRFPDGTIERVIVDGDGRWVAPTPYPLYDEEIVEARQIEFGKEPSDWVAERVRYDDEYWRERDRDDKKEDTKKPSKVEPRWTPPALNARDHFSYIKGYGNNIFGPNRTITRAEVAMIFARLSINQSTGGAPQFKDVKAGDWYKTAVDIMARQGVIKGYEDGTFRPNQPITRREFAAIAARYAGNLDTWKTFRDVPPTDWAYKLINRVAGAGWINGYEDGTFRPNNNITRAEVVAIVNRMLNRKADAKYVDNNLMRTKGAFVDNMRSAWYYYDIYEAAFGHSFERQPNGVDEKWNRVTGQAFEIRER